MKWNDIAGWGLLLHGSPSMAEHVLVASPPQERTRGIGSSDIGAGEWKWAGIAALGTLLHNVPFGPTFGKAVEKVLVVQPTMKLT